MNKNEFYSKLRQAKRPVIVDLWAPWCGPCRAMEPVFKQVSQKYYGRVEVWKINADDSPDVLRALGVMGIPTVLVFAHGEEIIRRTGMQNAGMLEILFDAALNGKKPDIIPLSSFDRLLRTVAGLLLLGFGWFYGQSWLLMGLGGIVLFSAFYDRCPVYKAVAPRIKEFFRKKTSLDHETK
jgi:thioredoxin